MTPLDRAQLASAARLALESLDKFAVPVCRAENGRREVTIARRDSGLVWRCRVCATSGAYLGETVAMRTSDVLARFLMVHLYGRCPC